jgi:hypothetical protein
MDSRSATTLTTLLAAALLAGCSSSGGTHSLRAGDDVSSFVRDVARGKGNAWTLFANASPTARRAWSNRAAIETIGDELRTDRTWWACPELSILIKHSSDPDRFGRAVSDTKPLGGPVISINEVADLSMRLTRAELTDIAAPYCKGQPQ